MNLSLNYLSQKMFRQILLCSFAGLGLETWWTGIFHHHWIMMGYSSVWYMLFYGSVPVWIPMVVDTFDWRQRILVYGLGITCVEYICMFSLWILLGHAPTQSKYMNRRWGIHGFTDLANIPSFVALGFTLEYMLNTIKG